MAVRKFKKGNKLAFQKGHIPYNKLKSGKKEENNVSVLRNRTIRHSENTKVKKNSLSGNNKLTEGTQSEEGYSLRKRPLIVDLQKSGPEPKKEKL